MKSEAGRPGLSIDLLLVAWWLFAFWVLATYGMRLGFLLYVEIGLDKHTDIVDRDFTNYWVGWKFALDGRHLVLFDQPEYFAYLKSLFGPDYQIHAWSYPPHFLMLVAPLGALDYRPALRGLPAGNLVMFVLAALAFRRRYAPETSQLYLWLALVWLRAHAGGSHAERISHQRPAPLCVRLHRERPVVAGLALALLTVKPQLGFLIPLLALVDRNWTLLRWAIVFTVVLVGLSVLLFGVDSWRAYFTQVIPYQQLVMNEWYGIFLRMMPSTFGSVRTLEFTPGIAHVVQWIVSGVAFAALLRLLFVLKDPLERVFAIVAGTFLISPYSFNYDMGAISVIAACLALRARTGHRTWKRRVQRARDPAGRGHGARRQGTAARALVLAASFAVLWLAARRPLATTVSG